MKQMEYIPQCKRVAEHEDGSRDVFIKTILNKEYLIKLDRKNAAACEMFCIGNSESYSELPDRVHESKFAKIDFPYGTTVCRLHFRIKDIEPHGIVHIDSYSFQIIDLDVNG